ncbi:hypothetical protein NKDENANG_01886 [Candidatus Entotheonellaceae bacterium PAL068K]
MPPRLGRNHMRIGVGLGQFDKRLAIDMPVRIDAGVIQTRP